MVITIKPFPDDIVAGSFWVIISGKVVQFSPERNFVTIGDSSEILKNRLHTGYFADQFSIENMINLTLLRIIIALRPGCHGAQLRLWFGPWARWCLFLKGFQPIAYLATELKIRSLKN